MRNVAATPSATPTPHSKAWHEHHDVLTLDIGSPDEELRRAYRWEGCNVAMTFRHYDMPDDAATVKRWIERFGAPVITATAKEVWWPAHHPTNDASKEITWPDGHAYDNVGEWLDAGWRSYSDIDNASVHGFRPGDLASYKDAMATKVTA